ncbi:A/G-specific adenine glycosylase [Castellaniella sp. FW104-16D08]|uniref:A/G-specific adenine glycosylase n=1 Tax=unclassified Castellaniella TaxID=2617606 RepID=UPI0033161A01
MAATDPASRIAGWQIQEGRHTLPWQDTRDPYRIWLSEIMLQQTQASTVIPYYQRFLELFPDVLALANAPADAVMHAWAGLGYYARARHLHRCAQQVRDHHQGRFPKDAQTLETLPGIGRSTAAAIAAFSDGQRQPILDGNVRRVLIRYLALEGDPASAAMTRTLWAHAQAWLDQAPESLDMRAYTQGQMDLGATVCTRHQPACTRCPLQEDCTARKQGLQNTLPRPRNRREVPRHECWMPVIECENHLWLQRRPAGGVWGSLWALPVCEHPSEADILLAHLGVSAKDRQNLAAFEHIFTHFRLRIRPLWLPAREPLQIVKAAATWPEICTTPSARQSKNPVLIPPEAGTHAWVPIAGLSGLGMPAPISRLLLGLYPGTD